MAGRGGQRGLRGPEQRLRIRAVLREARDAGADADVEALDWLEKCYAEKDTWSVWLGVLVEWDSLRTEPRFINLLNRLNLQPTTTK